MTSLRGIFPSIPTVFNHSGGLYEEAQRDVVRFCIEKGASGIACLLFGGEFYKLSDDERKRVAEVVVDETNGRVPVLVGTSHTGTEPSIMLSRHAQDIGAAGVIVTPPYHPAFSAEAFVSIEAHFKKIAHSLDVPVMIQDYETLAGAYVSPYDVVKISGASKNVKYMKIEGIGHLKKMADVISMTMDVSIFGGMAGRYILEELRLGAVGSIPGVAIVDLLSATYSEFVKGRRKAAEHVFTGCIPYLDFLMTRFTSFVAIEKEALRVRQIIDSSRTREPTIRPSRHDVADLERLIAGMELPRTK